MPDAYFRHHLEFADASWSPVGTIRRGGWSVVVLQAHPVEPLQKPEEFLSGAMRLAEEVRLAGAEPLLFQTYPPAEGHFIYRYEEWSGGNPAEMQARLAKAYARAADVTKARIARIGEACVLVAAITGKDPRAATWRPPLGVAEAEAVTLKEAAWRVSLE